MIPNKKPSVTKDIINTAKDKQCRYVLGYIEHVLQ